MSRKFDRAKLVEDEGEAPQPVITQPSTWPSLPEGLPEILQHRTVVVAEFERIYAVTRAQRQQRFQALIKRYTYQLIHGCSGPLCTAPTCFAFRRRVAQGPLRKLTALSARTIACYLATQEDPEKGLCPHLSKGPLLRPTAASTEPKRRAASDHNTWRSSESGLQAEHGAKGDPREATEAANRTPAGLSAPKVPLEIAQHGSATLAANAGEVGLGLRENHDGGASRSTETTRKDPKSLTQNLFDTRSLSGLETAIPRASLQVDGGNHGPGPTQDSGGPSVRSHDGSSDERLPHGAPDQASRASATGHPRMPQDGQSIKDTSQANQEKNESFPKHGLPATSRTVLPHSGVQGAPVRRRVASSDGHIANASSKPFSFKQPSPKDNRHDLPTDARRALLPLANDAGRRPGTRQVEIQDGPSSSGTSRSITPVAATSDSGTGIGDSEEPIHSWRTIVPNTHLGSNQDSTEGLPSMEPAYSLCSLSLKIVNALDQLVHSADKVAYERHRLYKYFDRHAELKLLHSDPVVRARQQAVQSYLEQSIYYVLSDPATMLASFNDKLRLVGGQRVEGTILLDPRNTDDAFRLLLYHKFDVVFESLWEGLEALFIPPPELAHPKSSRRSNFANSTSGSGRLSGNVPSEKPKRLRRYVDDAEATHIALLCLHALVAAVPRSTVTVGGLLAHLRATGLAGPDIIALEGDSGPFLLMGDMMRCVEVFENELCLRLASRLLRALATRIHFAELLKARADKSKPFAAGSDGSDFAGKLCVYLASCRPSDPRLRAIRERIKSRTSPTEAYEGRNYLPWSMPAVIVSWIHTVMLKAWDGKGEVSRFGAVGSAVTVLQSLYARRQWLGLETEIYQVPYLYDRLDALDAPVEWQSAAQTGKTIHLLSYPFLFPAAALFTYFRSLNFSCMSRAFETSLMNLRLMISLGILDPAEQPEHKLIHRLKTTVSTYLVLEIRRDNVLGDAFDQLWRRERRELLRPLKVRMGMDEGEEGVDHGGVQQEFFRIAIGQALDPDYGCFTVDPETRMIWFQPCALEPLYKFELLGLLVSLAVYNGVVLPLNFPKALYRKLLGLPVFAREHIQDGWPTLAKSFGQLLAWEDDDVKDVFMRTYEFSIEARGLRADIDMEQVGREDPWLHRVAHLFGGFPEIPEAGDQDPGESHRVHQLARGQDDPDEDVERPNAAEQPDVTHTPQSARMVTNGNRYDYVDDYIFWLTDKSVRPQYEAFARGFFTCLNKKALSIFTPEALQTVVEGSPNIDVAALEETARYEDGYSSTHPVIKDFWSIVHGYSAQERRQLLEFVTASERVPVSGMQSIQFIIQRNGPDSERLPTSLTCFGRLLLPEYPSRKKLRDKLRRALENSKGFGVP